MTSLHEQGEKKRTARRRWGQRRRGEEEALAIKRFLFERGGGDGREGNTPRDLF